MKLDYAQTSRILIALLFIVAGVQKLMHFTDTSGSIASMGVPLAPLATLIVIAIEIGVAGAFAWGYKTRLSGYILIGFTALVTVVVHRDLGNALNVIMALKNIAIIGGIMAAIGCACEDCAVHPKKRVSAEHAN